MEKKTELNAGKDLTRVQEISVTIHHAENGPSLESCMVSILSSHLSKSVNF